MGRHFYHRKDGNHDETIKELRDDGVSAHSTSSAGGSFPDVVIGVAGISIVGNAEALAALRDALRDGALPGLVVHEGVNLIVELKDGAKGDRRHAETREKQEAWARRWQGQAAKCLSVEEVFQLLGRRRQRSR